METEHYIAIAGVLATILGSLVAWIIAKRTNEKKQISYRLTIEPLFKRQIIDPDGQLEISYKNEQLVHPVLLSVDIANTGNVAIENPPIEVEAKDATYVIPGYFESVPDGYEDLWELERTDAESSAIRLEHINPGQIAKARFLLDELPKKGVVLKCPMPNLELKKLEKIEMNSFTEILLEVVSPRLASALKAIALTSR